MEQNYLTRKELKKAIRKLKQEKTPGVDEIRAETLNGWQSRGRYHRVNTANLCNHETWLLNSDDDNVSTLYFNIYGTA